MRNRINCRKKADPLAVAELGPHPDVLYRLDANGKPKWATDEFSAWLKRARELGLTARNLVDLLPGISRNSVISITSRSGAEKLPNPKLPSGNKVDGLAYVKPTPRPKPEKPVDRLASFLLAEGEHVLDAPIEIPFPRSHHKPPDPYVPPSVPERSIMVVPPSIVGPYVPPARKCQFPLWTGRTQF